jgi:23S rRNA pseudouridine2605 synthase
MQRSRRLAPQPAVGPRTGLARALSKLGFCSRSQAWERIAAGRVRVNGVAIRDPEKAVDWQRDCIEVDGRELRAASHVYLMLNKPRGLVATAADEGGRDTVFQCLAGRGLPFVSPVGRLDQASEGLLLFTNDTAWAARITNPASQLDKTYHVQVNCLADHALTRRLNDGVKADGDFLRTKRSAVLRRGEKNSWLEIVLDEGRNRHIRRLLAALEIEVLRLVRVAIGPLPLGDLAKGGYRLLTAREIAELGASRAGRRTKPDSNSKSLYRG